MIETFPCGEGHHHTGRTSFLDVPGSDESHSLIKTSARITHIHKLV
jgi:hypothetical protein